MVGAFVTIVIVAVDNILLELFHNNGDFLNTAVLNVSLKTVE